MTFIIIKRRINIWIYDQPPSPLCQDVSLHCLTPRRALTAVNSEINRFIRQSYLSCMPCPHCVASQKYSENPIFRGLRPITVSAGNVACAPCSLLPRQGKIRILLAASPKTVPSIDFLSRKVPDTDIRRHRPGHNRKYRTVPVCITRPSSVHSFCGLSVAVRVGDK